MPFAYALVLPRKALSLEKRSPSTVIALREQAARENDRMTFRASKEACLMETIKEKQSLKKKSYAQSNNNDQHRGRCESWQQYLLNLPSLSDSDSSLFFFGQDINKSVLFLFILFSKVQLQSTSELADHVAVVLQCFLEDLLSRVHLPTPLGAYGVRVVPVIRQKKNSTEQWMRAKCKVEGRKNGWWGKGKSYSKGRGQNFVQFQGRKK